MTVVLDAPGILYIMNKNPFNKTFKFSNASKLFLVYRLLSWVNFYKQKLHFLILYNMMPIIC